MESVIECQKLTKIYNNGKNALDNLDLTIKEASSLGLMGGNGAGKSTLIKLIMGFIYPTSGEIRVLGEQKVSAVHSRIGYLHEHAYGELRFSGRRYLSYMARLSGLWGKESLQRVDEVLAEVDLTLAGDARLVGYSKGMLQRLNIALMLLTDPDLLILDEPTSGLDPYSQWKVRQILLGLRKRGKTIFLCSHHLEEIELLCDTVAILDDGHLVKHAPVVNLMPASQVVKIVLGGAEPLEEIVARTELATKALKIDQEARTLFINAEVQGDVLRELLQASIPLLSLNPFQHTLEDIYLAATQDHNH